MERHDLTSVLREFAQTLVTDFPIQHILDRLVSRVADVLPGLAAGVTLIDSDCRPRYVAASTQMARRFELVQSSLGEGPCLEAYVTGVAAAVPDLATDDRFPAFSAAATDAGLAAVFAFPLRHGKGRMGAMDLYRLTPGPLSAEEMSAAQTLADVAAAYLVNAQMREEARRVADHYQHTSLHDPLTGLPNRTLLQERLEHAAHRAERSGRHAALLFLDLDRFKQVNDVHGHDVGDQLLVAVAERLADLVRPGDTLARLAGDEFVFLCEDMGGAADADVLARRIDDAFDEPFLVDGMRLSIAASVGVAISAVAGHLPRHSLGQADVAMYEAKRKGGGRHVTVDVRDGHMEHDRASLGGDLHSALATGALDVAYQPIVHVADGRIAAVEALLRWDRGGRGLVPTEVLIDVAEQVGLIGRLGLWVLERACRDVVQLVSLHPDHPLDLAVNVSTAQLLGPGFVRSVEQVLTSTGMRPGSLVLEVTETVAMQDPVRAMAVLHDLHGLGVRAALDDFGTGFSSLSYLRQLPVDAVKIDRSFVDAVEGASGEAIVAAVTDLAHVLGLTVTAEGVATAAQHAVLRRVGCDHAQGFLFSMPVPLADVRRMLEASNGHGSVLPLPTAAAAT